MNLYTIYDWITSLLRTRAGQQPEKALEAASATSSAANSNTPATAAVGVEQPVCDYESATFDKINNVAELIPTLNFVLYEPPNAASQHVDSDVSAHDVESNKQSDEDVNDNTNNDDDDDDDDNNSTRTFIISRSTTTRTTILSEASQATTNSDTTSLSPRTTTATTTTTETTDTEPETSSTDTSELLRQEVKLYLSLTDTEETLPSFTIDEPTSSITIEMAEQHTTGTTTTAASSTAATATSSTRGTSDGALPTTSQSFVTTPSSAAESASTSIEEEIEEAIDELSEEGGLSMAEQLDSLLSEASAFDVHTKVVVSHAMASTDDDDGDEYLVGAPKNVLTLCAKAESNVSDDEFQIDDEQLSGGQLMQHFVVDEDDDEGEEDHDDVVEGVDDDEDDDFDISLPLEKGSTVPHLHSRHASASGSEVVANSGIDMDAESEHQSTSKDVSLSNQSTADDVSDFVDEPRVTEEATHTSESLTKTQQHTLGNAATEPENTETSQKTATEQQETMTEQGTATEHETVTEQGTTTEHETVTEQGTQRTTQPEQTQSVSASQAGSDQPTPSDHQTVASYAQSAEMPTSVSTSTQPTQSNVRYTSEFVSNVEEDSKAIPTLQGGSPAHSELDHSLEEIVASNASIEYTLDVENITSLNASFIEQNQTLVNRLLTDESIEVTRAESPKPQEEEEVKQIMVTDLDANESTPKVQISEAKIIEHKHLKALETLQLMPSELEALELTLLEVDSSSELLNQTLNELAVSDADPDDDDEDVDTSLQLMKLRILAMQQVDAGGGRLSPVADTMVAAVSNEIKQMERVPLTDFGKDVLEDITEESERCISLSTAEEQQSLSLEQTDSKTLRQHLGEVEAHVNTIEESSSSLVSLNMLKRLERQVSELQNQLQSKDACLDSLKMQLEHNQQRRGSNGALSSTEQPVSARDTSSLLTNSTEYRTFQEDFGAPTLDIYMELTKRDELIAKLTDSLQQSLSVRENLQGDTERLNGEVQMLRRQLLDAMDTLKRPTWPRASDQESNGGQRISEISIDLISESDDDLERHFVTDNEEKITRNSRERQLSMPRQLPHDDLPTEVAPAWTPPFSKQIEQFQKYLTPNEVRLFFMVQRKFDNYMSQELEKCKLKFEQELKITMEQWETEKAERNREIQKMLQLKNAQDTQHSKEMEDLRKYFEHKCADLEKQFSDDVFSQKSQRHGVDSSSEGSEAEQMPEELVAGHTPAYFKETSPRKRTRAELLLSPSHRQMTPCGMDSLGEESKDGNGNISLEIADLKVFYQTKIHELKRAQDVKMRKLNERLKYYESRYPEDDFMKRSATAMATPSPISALLNNNNAQKRTCVKGEASAIDTTNEDEDDALHDDDDDDNGAIKDTLNTSLIIIDQDELNFKNESQVIQRIIEEYERRLQEQLALARKDIAKELELEIQNLLSDSTVDDQHWPKELILLREKFTAKSQLEITQLKIKHAEEMSRMKLEYEKQLNRKNKRHSTFDSARDLAHIISERDGLRELSKTFRNVLTQLARYVANCEDDMNATLLEEMQRLISLNRSVDGEELEQTLGASLLNSSLNATGKHLRIVPDVHSLLELVEDPSLVQFINNKTGDDTSEDFDLNDCLEKLKTEAAYLLQLSEDLHKQREQAHNSLASELEDVIEEEAEDLADIDQHSNASQHAEKHDSEAEDGLKLPQRIHKFLRAHSFNEQQLSASQQQLDNNQQRSAPHNSLTPDLNRLVSPAAELNLQMVELKNRLIKSETDRQKLQHQLDHTINRNAELGQELQSLRDQLSQLNSLNHTDYAEGYGLGSVLKSPPGSEHSSTSFVQLQEKARNLLSSPTRQQREDNDATVLLLQMIEDFCREGDKVVECGKKDRDDLQSQIDAADKQLKATRQFLEEQAGEREQERDEFVREIERLKALLREKEKERNSYANASEEYAQLEQQFRDVSQQLSEANAKRDKFEVELKASIDKIFVLREIISELETQIETKALNEHVLGEKVKQLEEYVGVQNHSNETLQHEVDSLKMEIGESYQTRISMLEEKLQNVRPSAEQSMVMDQIVEQLRDIEQALDQKTKTLEAVHSSTHSANSCSNSATEDISVHGSRPPPAAMPAASMLSPQAQGSPMHPSPRQHSITMESVQRVVDKLDRHTRAEEAAVKRVRDLDMQLTHLRGACVELQHERDTLQVRIDEQTHRIATLQTRLEEQRHRAEELHRAGTSDLNIRVQDLQTEVQTLNEKLTARDKQIANMKQQLEKSKKEIDHLEAQLSVQQQPDRSLVERLEAEVKQKSTEVQKLKDKIKSEMINRLALPDLMETMLADKNDEIDHLRAQLDAKEKELQSVLDSSQGSSFGGGAGNAGKKDASTKLSARTLSDIVSITEFDEPAVVRRAAVMQNSPLVLPEGSGGFLHNTMETSKEAVANLTHKRTEDLSGFAVQLRPANTFEHPHYFQDPNVLHGSVQSGGSLTPGLVPRQIHFSTMIDDSKLRTPSLLQGQTPDQTRPQSAERNEALKKLTHDLESMRQKLDTAEKDKVMLKTKQAQELQAIEEDFVATQLRLGGLQEELETRKAQIEELQKEAGNYKQLKSELAAKCAAHDELLKAQESLSKSFEKQKEELSKHEKNLRNYAEHEEKYLQRISNLEAQILEITVREAGERDNLRKELRCVSEAHEQCKYVQRDAEQRKREVEQLNQDIKAKDERSLKLSTDLALAEERCSALKHQVESLESDVARLKQQQSDNSSKQFSVDEIAQQVEKELNYSAQLDSNILKAIESEEENNLDSKQQHKEATKQAEQATAGTGTDDENFTGERELLNQLEALKTQLTVEREQCESIRQDLHAEKQHSQDIQEQDVVIIEAMRKRLETALDKEDDLHKQLDQERERCERLQTQLTSLQRAESRRNSSLLLKSPTESPRKSPRSLTDFEAELGERLRSEIKLLAAQNERERERSADIQRNGERERQRYEKELQERIEYCERLKREMEKLARDKDNAEQELDHLQERLTLQTAEIESLEARLVTLQEAETRRTTRRERQHQESAQLLAELQELKSKLMAAETERENLNKSIVQLRFDVKRGSEREAKLAEALAQANDRLMQSQVTGDDNLPQQFLEKMKDINELIATNTQENRQMAESMQFLVNDRRALQRRVEELEGQLSSSPNATELEERCRHLFGRYLRVESHRKALVYQKRYLKMSLESYQESEQRALAAIQGAHVLQRSPRNKKKLFKTVALAIIAIQRIKYIGRIWHTGKRIVSKSVFTITQQKRPTPTTNCPNANNNAASYLPPSPTLPPTVNLSTMNPINLPPDLTLQAPTTAFVGMPQPHSDCTLPSLARLDWPSTQALTKRTAANNTQKHRMELND